MTAAKTGVIAEFETGYLQREIRLIATVANGPDTGLRDSSKTGFAVGRLVKVTGTPGAYAVGLPTTGAGSKGAAGVVADGIGDATHIIAQSDDTIRDEPSDYNEMERYSSLPNLICKDSTTKKTVALYKIVNPDDIKLVKLN